ncbi:MAG: stage III sporulation protein AA [Lachnospiraceae bacterium]
MQDEILITLFPIHRRKQIRILLQQYPDAEELRVRIRRPILLRTGEGVFYFDSREQQGCPFLAETVCQTSDLMTEAELREMLSYMTRYSLYAFESELQQGFVTVQGGHRIGIAGQVFTQNGQVKNFSNITFFNIRIARQVQGCARTLMPYLRRKQGGIFHTLLVSPPGMGKTTMLRDGIRLLSGGDTDHAGMNVGVVDERFELSACFRGVPQLDLGPQTDVLAGCRKPQGILMLLRSMAPKVLAVDELGGEEDYQAVEEAFTCGCSILGTMHGGSLEEVQKRPQIQRWCEEGLLQRIVFLKKDEGGKRGFLIYDGTGKQLWEE